MSTVCSQCGGTDIEYDSARGDAVCTGCGSVLEDNIIVSEVTFQEQSSGASSLVGQFVSASGAGGAKGALSGAGFHHGLSRDSREVTLQHAKQRLSRLGQMLKLNQHCIDTAFGFFKMALQLNLTRGRKSSIMDTACLYLVCRSEGTPHMLLDFSDVLQINVYSLGRAYLKLANALHINPPAIDPCLYIHRFAHRLELGDKVNDVSMTALRLVARMKRDWIHHGRRPAGLCGAALLVSARLHNFSRSVREVARVVKLSEGTIRKRLGDFKDTPSSRLTIDEFLKIDLEQEHDPPCYLEAKKKTKQGQQSGEEEGEESDHDEQEEEIGFGGIKLSSVDEIIARARMTEAFLSVSTAGLSDNLQDLSKLVDDNNNDDDEGVEDTVETSEKEKEDCDTFDDIDDDEIEQMLLSEEEVKIKSQLWFAENADYLKELEEKKERLAALEAEKSTRTRKKSTRKRRRDYQYNPAATAGEAIERMLVEKKISAKINYDVLRVLDSPSVSDTTVALQEEPVAPPVVETGPLASSRNRPLTGGGVSASNRYPSFRSRKRTLPALADPSTVEPKHQRTEPSLIDSLLAPSSCEETGSGCVNDDVTQEAVIEESGPIQYLEEDEEEEGEMEDMGYEGDPLLYSDYEEAGDDY